MHRTLYMYIAVRTIHSQDTEQEKKKKTTEQYHHYKYEYKNTLNMEK